MKMMAIAGLLITLPALVIVIFFFGRPMMFPALASFLVNLIPFAVAGWFIRKQKNAGAEFEEH